MIFKDKKHELKCLVPYQWGAKGVPVFFISEFKKLNIIDDKINKLFCKNCLIIILRSQICNNLFSNARLRLDLIYFTLNRFLSRNFVRRSLNLFTSF